MSLSVKTIYGSLYDASTGQKITSGRLLIQLSTFVTVDGELVAPIPVVVDIPPSGDLNFSLAPSGSVSYRVQFDPDPNSSLPLTLRPGYFVNNWIIPAVLHYPLWVDIATL